ncbi:TadE/TadG family type IV pilus assembly protein [Cellulomonas sp. C5510]|uniref:TadE/TadG family type IV pilus assembly protein n=1 Tax=Cellulomonas sp. C5510 TaxID=2871170 RepID=UPI001C93B9BD|nr:TadE/TadG family type IV pilus assembly protein [Cellulomonas sp. C5510]QZN87030.1 pilus assembly protein [Cellulomonas sp. C5510]
MNGLLARARRRGGRPSDEGSTVVEVVILAPALALFLGLIVAGGRLAVAHQAVEAAAAQAARSASIARTQDEALTSAQAAAVSALGAQGLNCVASDVSVDVAGFATPAGTPASVGATVTCQVPLADTLPGLPGSVGVTATVRSALDTYRER